MDTRRESIPTERITLPLYKRLVALAGDAYTIMRPVLPELARGMRASDGLFEHDPRRAADWLVFVEPEDRVFWNMRSGDLARETGWAFALGEAILTNPGTFALDGTLHLFESPATWLQQHRRGIVVIDWRRLYTVLFLLDAPRISVATPLAERFTKTMDARQYRPLVEIVEE